MNSKLLDNLINTITFLQGVGIAASSFRANSNASLNNDSNVNNKQSGVGGLLWSGSPHQLALVEMMSLLRVLPLHTLVATVKQVVKQPPIVDGAQQLSSLLFL